MCPQRSLESGGGFVGAAQVAPADARYSVPAFAKAVLAPFLGQYGVCGVAVLHRAVELYDQHSREQEVDSADQVTGFVADLHLELWFREIVVCHQYAEA